MNEGRKEERAIVPRDTLAFAFAAKNFPLYDLGRQRLTRMVFFSKEKHRVTIDRSVSSLFPRQRWNR